MAYYPNPNQGPGYSVAYYPPPANQDQQGYNNAQGYNNDYNRPRPFPTDDYGPPSSYPQPGGYGPPGQYPPEQYPPPGPYGQPSFQPGYGGQMEYGSQVGYGGQPITNQPGPPLGGDWMAMPQGPPNCPPGLEYLMSLSNLFVKQKVEFLEALTGFETCNKFTIKNDRGEKFYWAVEESDLCTRNCLGALHPFEMRIMDSHQNEVIHLSRGLGCADCCCPCCLQKMEVFAPPGNLIGTIEQEWSLFYPKFKIKDSTEKTVLKIKGPFCSFGFCGQSEFQILSRDEQVKVGKIVKQWSGFVREMFTDADYFGISFPLDLDVRMKAVMIGALFLIDAIYFENNQSSR